MRRLSSQKDDEKKQKRNQLTIGLILVALMVFSIFGIIVNSFGKDADIEKLNYKGLELIQQGSYYQLNVGEVSFYFSENPNNLSSIEYDINMSKIITAYTGKPLYIDSSDYQSTREIAQNIQEYPLRIQNACLTKEDCLSEDLPIKTCDENIIVIRESDENRIYENDSCVFIEGKKEDLLKMSDIFILKILGLN